jgi:AraC-like DNA-binding protein
MTFRARFIGNIIQFAAQQGVDRSGLLAITGKSLEALNDDQLEFESSVYNQIIERAVAEARNPQLGLQLGASLSLSAAGLVLQIVQSSRTIKEALQLMVTFNNLGCQSMPFRLEQMGSEWRLSVHPDPGWARQSPLAVRHTMDGMMLFTLRQLDALTRQTYQAGCVHFNYEKPADTAFYRQWIKCPIYFDQSITGIFLDSRKVEEPVVTSDYQLLKILVNYAEQKLRALNKKQGFASQVRQAILQLATPQLPSIEQVAASLNLSVRSLQRKLKVEHFTYKSLLDELKHRAALDHLRKGELPIKEIAYLLDYAEASSFTRSFKRWEGVSPEAYRKEHAPSILNKFDQKY